MIRVSMMLLATIMLISQAPAEESVDACFHRSPFTVMRLTREYLRDMVQVCSNALESPGTQLSPIKDPGVRARVLSQRRLAYKLLGDDEKALADLDETIRFLHETPTQHLKSLTEALYERYNTYIVRGERDRAMTDLGEIIRLDPENVAAFSGRGQIYAFLEDYDRAIADFSEAIRLLQKTPGSPPSFALVEALSDRAAAYSAKGEHDRAIADFGEASRNSPEYAPSGLTSRGMIYAQDKHDYDRAIAEFDEALRLQPNYVYALIGRGLAYRAKGVFDRAAADIAAAEQISPQAKSMVEREWQARAGSKNP